MYRSAFDREIGTPPPPTIDVDRVIRRRRRARRLRTALVGTAAGVSAVALVGVTVSTLPGDRGGEMFGNPNPPSPPPPSASADPVAARLEAALRGFLNAKLPNAEYRANRPKSGPQFGPLAFEHRYREATSDGVMMPENYYFATADITGATGTGNIGVSVGRADPDRFHITATCPEERPLDTQTYSCTPSTGTAGEKIMVERSGGTRATHYRVEVVRPSGVAVSLWVTNNSRQGAKGEVELDRQDSPVPPLTADEARDLALLPALTV